MDGISLGPLLIRWNGLLVALGIAIGALLAAYEAKRRDIDPEIIYDLFCRWRFGGLLERAFGMSSPHPFPPFSLV